MTTPALREKLRLIRDSDHPASPWARDIIQLLDTMEPDDPDAIRQLGKNVAMFEHVMVTRARPYLPHLTPDEIAAIFGLGGHPRDHQ